MISFILILCTATYATQPLPVKPHGPGTKEAKEEIMGLIRDGMRARREEADLREQFELLRKQGTQELAEQKNQGTLELAEQKLEAAERKRAEKEAALGLAIEKTEHLYNVKVVQPAGSRIVAGPLAGAQVAWSPKFLDEGYEFREVQGTDGRRHYFGANFKPDVMGVTWPDGETVILPTLFDVAKRENDPGILAALLYHEAFHFNELVTQRWDTIQAGEVRAYDAELAKAATFSLSAVQRKKAKGEQAANQADLDSGDITKIFQAYPVPDQEEWAKRQFDTHVKEQQQLKADMDKFKADLKAEHPRAQAPARDPGNDVWGLAERICSDPRHAKQDELDSVMDALIAFCRQNSCGLAEAENQPCAGKLQSAMFQEARRGHRIPLDLLEKQGPVQWIDLSQIRGPGCYDTCLALAKIANAACDDPESVSQEELDGILANDDGALYAQNIAILECPSKLLDAMMRAKKGGRRIRADWLKAMARRIGPKDYRFEEALIAFSEKACRYSVDHDDAIDLKRLRGAPVRTPPDPPSDPCAAYVYSKLSGLDDLPQYPEDYAIRLVGSWRASQQPSQSTDSDDGDRRRGGDSSSGGHGVPDRHWNPTFHPN